MSSWNSYPKVWNLGHAATECLIGRECRVEEKLDGSQFSFGLIDGELKIKSRRVEMNPSAPNDLFAFAAATVLELKDALVPGWTYRGEAFKSPKHNSLAYGRVPRRNIGIFDIARAENAYLTRVEIVAECERLDLEYVQCFGLIEIESIEQIRSYHERTSALGDVPIEGVVLKPTRPIYGEDGKPLYTKVVSEAFRELHARNPEYLTSSKKDVITNIAEAVSTKARWDKTIQRVRDDGKLEGTPRDISALVQELQADIAEECEEFIKNALYNSYRKKILGASVRGFPEYYKSKLEEDIFNG